MRLPASPSLLQLVLFTTVACAAFAAGCGACGQVGALPDGGVDALPDSGTPVVVPAHRCHVPLDAWVSTSGSGASIKRMQSASDGIGGPTAYGKGGDYLLQNDRIRVVIQGEDRHIGANPYGGTILDADLVRAGPGQDQFGELGLLYNFGRTVDPRHFEVLRDGAGGGAVVLATSGTDADNDYLSIRNQLRNQLGTVPVADPYVAVPLKITNYFVLNPGESRVRYVTAFCNTGSAEVSLAVGDLTDPGYTVEFFNGQSCTNGFGFGGLCFGLDRMSWYGYQGNGVAYGYAPYRPVAPAWPEPQNAVLTVSGITGAILGAPGLQGLLDWFNPEVQNRGGELKLQPGQARAVVRDFLVGRDLGEVASAIYQSRAGLTDGEVGKVSGVVTHGGAPVPAARVTVRTTDQLFSVFVTGDDGRFEGVVPAGTYLISAWAAGRAPTAEKTVVVGESAPASADFDLAATRSLTVQVADAATGAPLPAKVTVLCPGTCATTSTRLNVFTDALRDPLLDGIAHLGLVPPSGEATFQLPPGQYQVVVSRGPEYSIFPNTWPSTAGVPVDLRTADATVDAKLARVVDTTGFVSADFHVHAVNSPDSAVDNTTRVLTFLAEGVDVLVSTDHDFVTDFAPSVAAVGAEDLLSTVVGQEVSTMDFGHYNLFPMNHDPSDVITGGAVDWAGGFGPTLTVSQLFEEGRKRGAKVIHFNHPRGFLGGLTHLKVDMDTLATHANPADFRMATPPDATAEDTKILSSSFDALEVLNSGEDAFEWAEMYPRFNDWFTLLSRGLRVTATGVSDTHTRNALAGGYWRTWVRTGTDHPSQFSADQLATALKAQHASASNGLFVKVRAVRVNAAGAETSLPAKMGETLAASSDPVKVTVEVQAPEYLDVTKVELYTHAPQDDARCPIDPASPSARTARVGCNGQPSLNWPSESIAAVQAVTLGAADLEPVLTVDGVTYKRWRKTLTFQLPAPGTDNWIVAFVYGTRPLFPLVFDKIKPGSANVPVRPFALTNPIYVDANGGGYDQPPFNAAAAKSLRSVLPAQEPRRRSAPPTAQELLDAWAPVFGTH